MSFNSDKQKRTENTANVLSNKDLFMYIQSFANGYEGSIMNFSRQFHPKLSFWKLLEEALAEEDHMIADKIYNKIQDQLKEDSLSIWDEYGIYGLSYPHRAYSLLSTCEWLNNRMGDKFLNWNIYVNTAACVGDLNMIMFMHTQECKGFSSKTMDIAASNGHLDVVEFLHSYRTEGCTTDAMDEAAAGGYLIVMKFLYANRSEGCTTNAMDWASRYGHLDVVKYLHKNRTGCTDKAIIRATERGHIEVVEYLRRKGY